MSGLELQGVSRLFGDVRAVDGVDLSAPDRSVTAVLGPSGCGKTTLLRLIAGFLAPSAGSICFGDRVVAGPGRFLAPQRRRVGYVPQEGALFPHLDVAANVAFGLSRAQRRSALVQEMLDLVELPAAYAGRRPHELSGGQQQRVALARALAPRPSIVLLDEPFSSLDASLRVSTGRAVIRAIRAAQATAVLVTHDQDEALSLADQVAVMRAGRVIQAGRPDEVYLHPADAEVARFVGGAAVLDATVTGGIATTALGDLVVAGEVADGPTAVLVRPEQIRLNEPSASIKATVEEVHYYGHDASVLVVLGDDASGEAGPESRLVARITGNDLPTPGARVTVSVVGPVVAAR